MCSNMDGPRGYHTEWSQTENNKYPITSFICSLKINDTNELAKWKETHRLREWTYGCWGSGGRMGEGIARVLRWTCTHCCI